MLALETLKTPTNITIDGKQLNIQPHNIAKNKPLKGMALTECPQSACLLACLLDGLLFYFLACLLAYLPACLP